MRRALWCAVLVCVACPVAFTQDSPSAVAEREEAQERYKRMSAKIEDLENTIQTYNQQFQKLENEIHRLRNELAKAREAGSDSGALAEVRRKIELVDRAREADQENVMKQLAQLRKDLVGTVTKPKANSAPAAPNVTEKGLEYEIREGDTLNKLVIALNKQGVKVTQKQIEQANPGVNWNALKIGKKIFIPASPPN